MELRWAIRTWDRGRFLSREAVVTREQESFKCNAGMRDDIRDAVNHDWIAPWGETLTKGEKKKKKEEIKEERTKTGGWGRTNYWGKRAEEKEEARTLFLLFFFLTFCALFASLVLAFLSLSLYSILSLARSLLFRWAGPPHQLPRDLSFFLIPLFKHRVPYIFPRSSSYSSTADGAPFITCNIFAGRTIKYTHI